MASMLGMGHSSHSTIKGGARRDVRDADGLAAFRLRAEIEHSRSLTKLIECEIIPRLMVAHPVAAELAETGGQGDQIDAAEVEAFAPLALEVEADLLLDHAEAILRRGVAIDTLLVDLLAPAARLLGEYWEADRCDFVDVTMGLWRLQEIVHELAARMPGERPAAIDGKRALFASMPGDQHSFGTVVVDELFVREGWITDRLAEAETGLLLGRVSADWFDLLGLTVSCDCHIASLTSIISSLRTVSRNPRLCVMVGGRVFVADPDLAAAVGADGTAADAKVAVKVAGGLIRAIEREVLA